MKISIEKSMSIPMELDIGNTTDSIQRFLESQKDLFHIQIDQLQKVVATQCKLTGVNPLSQEMAAGALSINIGKRPRDLLNPKATKYMQSVFSIKDTISKKESREISALCGVTVTQVREFFSGQRSRVRKLVRLSKDKAIKSDACKTSQDGFSNSSDHDMPVIDQAPLNSVDPKTVEEGPSKEEIIPGIDDSDKNFLENIFTLMRKEETFSGQVELMEWILQIQNPSVLYWFLTKGGVMMLAAWLSQAALEEQTTVLLAILKVLCHLPLHKALPVQMSAILQTVNRLRFYRTPDISNRAKVLLTRWSKLFVRSQALRKPSFTNFPNDAQKEKFFSQTTAEMVSNEWMAKIDLHEEISALSFENSENCRKSEPSHALNLLPASTDDSNKKHYRGVCSPQTRERRKVLLVEQPGQNTSRRSLKIGRAVPSNQGRPMSADDIQKAKMRAIFMQSKYGKPGGSSESKLQKPQDQNKSSASQTSNLHLVSPKTREDKKPVVFASESSALPEAPMDLKLSPGPREPSWEKLKKDRIPWQTAPEIRINSLWRVGLGEKSKEIEIQTRRIQREKETIYQGRQSIPSDPKEPWDLEMDYDDTLTPEIPTEQPPNADVAETSSSPANAENTADTSPTTPAAVSSENAPEPDLELLAVLLKNPELVFALTSGQGSSLMSAETVRLLDMIKTNGISLTGGLNGVERDAKNTQVTSLPSPTPSEPVMNGWRAEVAKDLYSLPVSGGNREHPLLPEKVPLTGLVQPQTQTANHALPHLPAMATLTQQHPIINSESLPAGLNPHSIPVSSLPMPQMLASSFSERLHSPAIDYATNQSSPAINPFQQSILPAGLVSLQRETRSFGQMQNVTPAPISIVLNHPPKDRSSIALPSFPPLLLNPLRPELLLPHLPDPPPSMQPLHPTSQWNRIFTAGRQNPLFDSSGSGSSTSNGRQVSECSWSNQNYNVFSGGPMQPPPRRERNGRVGEPEFETWSPERSLERSPEYRSGRNFSDSRRDSGRNSRTEWSRRWDSGRRDYRSYGNNNRRWRERRH